MDCIICAYPIDNKERLLCLTPCGHNEHVCSICFLRMRSLQRNFHCPTCKRELEQVICSFTEETVVPVAPNTQLALTQDNNKDNKDNNKDNKDKDKAGGGRGRSRAKEKEKEKEKEDVLVSSSTAAVNVAAVSAIGYAAKTRFEDFQIWGEQISEPYYIYDGRSQMFVPRFYFDEVVAKLYEFKCKICHAKRKDFKELRGHYFGEHKLSMCLLCIEFKQVFPSEQCVYSKTEYERHLRRGDHDGSKGHPNCEFCKKRFYDSTPLFQHLTRDHYSCHLCTQQGIRFKYFDKYPDLEAHFRKDHWICEDPACLQRGFMAFANDIDLMSHRVQYHPQLCMGSRTIPVQFKYRSNANNNNNNNNNNNSNTSSTPAANAEGDSEYATRTARFEGGIGGRAQNGEWQVEIELTTADPRDPNRNLLQEDVPPTPSPSLSAAAAAAEDFPELPSSSGAPSSAVAMNRWVAMQSAKQQKKSKANPFPALPSAPKKTGTALAPGIVAPPRPPPTSSSSSTAAALLEDFAAVSASGTRPSTVADSLGNWANIKVDKRVPKAKKSAAPATTSSSTAVESTEREGVKASATEDDFSADLQRALAQSLQESFPEPPRPAPAPAPAAAPKPKPAVQKKAASSNDWSDALKAVGMAGAVKKKSPGITVIKAGKSDADKKLIVGTSGKQPGSWVSLGGTGAKAVRAERAPEREIPGFPSLSASSK